jgi:putative spermidine/putrescine transport system substrate-binding protein
MNQALAADKLLVVQWGAKWIEVSKEILAEYNKTDGTQVAWELHSGGAAAIVAKIKAAWPNVKYNVISAWTPVFESMIAEDWLVPVTVDKAPNIKDIPDVYFAKNKKGEKMNVPLSTAGAFWGYRTDLVDKPIESVEQLLEPRFKGKIAVPYPVNLTGLFIVTLAIQRGGNEFNIEPGWEFAKELARRGNIGRICNNNSEFINTMASGEVSVGFWNNGGWFITMERFPCKILNRLKDNKGFLYNEGFCVVKGSPEAAAFRLANYFAGAEMNTKYNWNIGSGPTNPKSTTNPAIKELYYTPDELPKYAYFADFPHIMKQLDGWSKRWEQDVVQLLRK